MLSNEKKYLMVDINYIVYGCSDENFVESDVENIKLNIDLNKNSSIDSIIDYVKNSIVKLIKK